MAGPKELRYERHRLLSTPKGPTAKYRARRRRADDAERLRVRAVCVVRDGYCKFGMLGGCEGPSEHAHLWQWKRARTRGMAPELRHTLQGSCMACKHHHAEEEAGRLTVSAFADLGANGPMRVTYRGRVYMINS